MTTVRPHVSLLKTATVPSLQIAWVFVGLKPKRYPIWMLPPIVAWLREYTARSVSNHLNAGIVFPVSASW